MVFFASTFTHRRGLLPLCCATNFHLSYRPSFCTFCTIICRVYSLRANKWLAAADGLPYPARRFSFASGTTSLLLVLPLLLELHEILKQDRKGQESLGLVAVACLSFSLSNESHRCGSPRCFAVASTTAWDHPKPSSFFFS